jgi:hypothetical protein
VCGVPIEMSEDMVRRDYIDKAAKDIKPTVRPKLYSVEFVPIEHNGVLKGNNGKQIKRENGSCCIYLFTWILMYGCVLE